MRYCIGSCVASGERVLMYERCKQLETGRCVASKKSDDKASAAANRMNLILPIEKVMVHACGGSLPEACKVAQVCQMQTRLRDVSTVLTD